MKMTLFHRKGGVIMNFNNFAKAFSSDLDKLIPEERDTLKDIKGNTITNLYELALERGRALEYGNISNITVANGDIVLGCCNELNGLYTTLGNLTKSDDIETNADMFYFLSKSIDRIANNLCESVHYLKDIM